MKTKMKGSIALVMALFMVMGSAYACSCIYLPDAQAKYDNARVVFSGKVTEINGVLLGDWYDNKAIFETSAVWKSNGTISEGETLEIYFTPNDGANCGFDFEEGREYLIYGYYDEDGKLAVNSCTGSGLFEDLSEEVLELEELAPRNTAGDTDVTGSSGHDDGSNDKNPRGTLSRFFGWLKSIFS